MVCDGRTVRQSRSKGWQRSVVEGWSSALSGMGSTCIHNLFRVTNRMLTAFGFSCARPAHAAAKQAKREAGSYSHVACLVSDTAPAGAFKKNWSTGVLEQGVVCSPTHHSPTPTFSSPPFRSKQENVISKLVTQPNRRVP
jgi:hypothetical protein